MPKVTPKTKKVKVEYFNPLEFKDYYGFNKTVCKKPTYLDEYICNVSLTFKKPSYDSTQEFPMPNISKSNTQ